MVEWYLGTVGFSYKDWNGVFYPPGTAARQYLAHYSQIFNSVELDSTFYGTPPPERVQQWAMTAPPGFKFSVKTPRQITHDLRLIGAIEPMMTFLETMNLLGDKLGPVLIQLPPSLTIGAIDTVNDFITALPAEWRYAVEFRHESWFTPQTAALLAAHRICWVSTEYVDVPKQVVPTTDFLYIRWLGRHGQFEYKGQEQIDVTPQLHWWIDQLQPHLPRFETIYGFFNNDYSGHSPRTCNRFKEMIGLATSYPEIPQQGRLF
ncbi:MAG: DUF72 domain-containing protein [Anaerolineae bacterium]|nr:DUF72 domain-containing protein [Anaerolineae bacterium]